MNNEVIAHDCCLLGRRRTRRRPQAKRARAPGARPSPRSKQPRAGRERDGQDREAGGVRRERAKSDEPNASATFAARPFVRAAPRLHRRRARKRRRGVVTRRRGRPPAQHRVRSPPGRPASLRSALFVQYVICGAPDEPRGRLDVRHRGVDDAFAGLQSTTPNISATSPT